MKQQLFFCMYIFGLTSLYAYNQLHLAVIENDKQKIKNTVSSSYAGFDAPFERQVYISRIAVYDENKNLIGVATLSSPILKEETQDLTFKIKLDI